MRRRHLLPSRVQVLPGEESEREHGAVQVVVQVGLGGGADAAHHQLAHVLPAEVTGGVVRQGDANSPLETVMQVELAAAGQLVAMIHQHGHVLAGGGWKDKKEGVRHRLFDI